MIHSQRSKFEFIFSLKNSNAAENAKFASCSTSRLCRIFLVSETGYYKWRRRRGVLSSRLLLLEEIRKIIAEHQDNTNYGVPRMRLALAQKGIKRSQSTVRRAMILGNLIHRHHRRANSITKADKKASKSPNIIERDFYANEPYKKFIGDITEISCKGGKLYVSIVVDCYSGEILGLAMANNRQASLCVAALDDAFRNIKPAPGAIFHSDAGSQYTSEEFRAALGKYNLIQSMGGIGRCYDNCRLESIFAIMKKEKIYKLKANNMTIEQMKTEVWRFVQYYNRQRVCTFTEGGWPPSIFRERNEAKQNKATS